MSVLKPLWKSNPTVEKGQRALVKAILASVVLGASIGFWIGFRLFSRPVPACDCSALAAADLADESDGQTPGPSPALTTPQPTPPGPAVPKGVVALAPPSSAAPLLETLSREIQRVDLTLRGSLVQSLAGVLDGRQADVLSAHVGRLLIWWLDLRRDVLSGDRLQVVYEPTPGPGEIRILALRYQSGKTGQTYQAFLFQRPGSKFGRYFDAAGIEVEERLENPPIEEYEQITELINLTGRHHRGIDFKTDVGTPVKLPFRAQILRRNWGGRGNGNCLEATYLESGLRASFLHLDKVLPAAQPGAILPAGTVVALSGNTGRSTAPHLHYQLFDEGGRILNPYRVHKTLRRQLPETELASFTSRRIELEREMDGMARSE